MKEIQELKMLPLILPFNKMNAYNAELIVVTNFFDPQNEKKALICLKMKKVIYDVGLGILKSKEPLPNLTI